MSNTAFISGSDGVAVIYSPGARFQVWALSEIYMGGIGANKFIPNVNDRVIDTETDEWYAVSNVDPTTFVPTLEKRTAVPDAVFNPNDLLLGVGPGTQSDTYRVYVDKSVLPYTMCVDARLWVAGSAANSVVIYSGSLLDNTAEAISAIYDQNGNMLGQNIPLEIINATHKVVPVCHTSVNLNDGEVVTAVFYSTNGNVVSKRQLLIENTAFIRSPDAAVKYITGISLESPFLSPNDNSLIQYPINVPLEGLMLIGVVSYSDGSELRMPVDGSKFSIYGFSGYIATIVGQKFDLVLKYTLSQGEVVYGAQNVDNHVGGEFITATYKATTLKASGAFSVKLSAFPVWISDAMGYQLQWFMHTLDRTRIYNVTPYVRVNDNSAAFNPTAYGVSQQLSVNINMSDVDGLFSTYKHVQSINITLVAPAHARTTNWTIGFTPNQNPQFGVDNYARSVRIPPVNQGGQEIWQVNLSSGSPTQTDWLNKLYFNTLPLIDPTSEAVAITPNMFSLVINGVDVTYPMSAWNTSLTVASAVPDNSTLFIKFLLRTPTNDVVLSIAGIPVYQS